MGNIRGPNLLLNGSGTSGTTSWQVTGIVTSTASGFTLSTNATLSQSVTVLNTPNEAYLMLQLLPSTVTSDGYVPGWVHVEASNTLGSYDFWVPLSKRVYNLFGATIPFDEVLALQTSDEAKETTFKITVRAHHELTVKNLEFRMLEDSALNELEENTNEALDELETNLETAKTELWSKIEKTEDQILLEVGQKITSLDGKVEQYQSSITIRADQIESSVSAQGTQINGLDGRMGSAESSITQQAWEITQKVSTTDYNGNTIASMINQTSTTITIQASKIELRGAVYFLSEISDDMGTIYAGTINGVNINSAYINISQDATIGNNLYLGGSGWGTKSVNFGSGSVITYNGSYLSMSSNYVRLDGSNNELNGYNTIYGTLNVPYSTNVIGVVRAESSGIGISYSNGYLIVKEHGSTVGQVKLS